MAVLEEELKNRIGERYFKHFDYKKIIGKIDFCVAKKITSRTKQQELFMKNDSDTDLTQSFLWAEAKAGTSHDIYASLVQLILTIGKARTFERHVTPPFLGAFDAEKIAFVAWKSIESVFNQNDFNWKVTPSDHNSKEFKQLYSLVKKTLKKESFLFYYARDDIELREFITKNLIPNSTEINQIVITKNNFTSVYYKWAKQVRDTIAVPGGWEELKKKTGILDADFYLADLLSRDSLSLKESLFVYLRQDHYEFDKGVDRDGFEVLKKVKFTDNQEAYLQFWKNYKRPPRKDYWDYIVKRRDLLVPQDIRERKGSFFTPQIWVEKSQEYLEKVLGENWQDEYYIWDCCAGTGNLLAGLTNPYNIWASTIDKADVSVMLDRINNGANLLSTHVFQFDFLNDDFYGDKVPDSLKELLRDPEKRKKMVVYINPPYAEATTAKTATGTGQNKSQVATSNEIYSKYKKIMGNASKELFAQFFIRIGQEINGCILGEFSTLKVLQAQNFQKFRQAFQYKLDSMFVVPSYTFDNVKGQFPIGFLIWDTSVKQQVVKKKADVFDEDGRKLGTKTFYGNLPASINKWIKQYDIPMSLNIGYMENPTPDVQNNKFLCITNNEGTRHNNYLVFNQDSLIPGSIYLASRLCIKAGWLNNRDQFLSPNKNWETDKEFQSDCLTFTLFHGQNRITSSLGVNYWIPFKEKEVNAKDAFKSHFMTDFINGKLSNSTNSLFVPKEKLSFSDESKAVFEAGRALWTYYHAQTNAKVDASLYDIKEYFQGRDEKGRMNNKSDNEKYNELISTLRVKLEILGNKIMPKVHEYGFLKK